MLRLEDKKAIVQALNSCVEDAQSAVVADYRKLKVAALDELRSTCRKNNVHVQVVRNTLAKRALENTAFDCLNEKLVGPTILAFSFEEPGAAAKIFVKFMKDNKDLEVTALALGGQLLPASQLKAISQLPNREQALSIFMGTVMGPANTMAGMLRDVPSKLVRTLAAIRDQKTN